MFCSTENRITVWLFQIVNPFASNEQHLRQLFIYLFFFRSNRPEVFCKKGALRNFIKFTGKHLCQSLIFNKVLLKMRLWHRCFPMNFVKFLRTPFFIEHLWWLLLFVIGPFCITHSICFNNVKTKLLLIEQFFMEMLVLSNKKQYSNFSENFFQSWIIENVQNFQLLSHKNIPNSKAECYFKNP